MQLLWVEDEAQLVAEGSRFLQQEGFAVTAAGTGAEALKRLEAGGIDLVLLDWMLPDIPGIDLCKQIRQTWSLPVIMLTAKSDEFDKVLALELGADDYVAKPFGMRELVARIRAVMRRVDKAEKQDAVLERGDLLIDPQRHVVLKRGEPVPLTPTEFALLLVMARHPSRVYSRLQLMDEALGDAYFGYERTIDSHIRNLRKKLEDSPENPRYIATVHGIGYKFVQGGA